MRNDISVNLLISKMGIKGQDVISCRGGRGIHVTRGERRIFEMERHLRCMKEKITTLETMLPSSATSLKDLDCELETRDKKECSKLDEKNASGVCVLQSLGIKEKKLRNEITSMECKEKKYLNALSKMKLNMNKREEMKKPDGNCEVARNNNSQMSRREKCEGNDKILQIKEYTKKLCDCLRTLQSNHKEWSRETEDLSKELDGFEDLGLKEFSADFTIEKYQERGDVCPCGEPAKCNSCTICTCSDWEKDLEIVEKESPEKSKDLKHQSEKPAGKKDCCRCFQSSSSSTLKSNSLEINDIYNCSISEIQSDMSIATTSIPSTVENVILGDEEDGKKFCCLCNDEDECQKLCEICLCEWERQYRVNQQLFLDGYELYDLCEICHQERSRGGTDLRIPFNEELRNGDFHQGLRKIENRLINVPGETMKIESNMSNKVPSSTDTSQISKNLQIEELKMNVQNLQNANNLLRKWLQNANHQINFNPTKDNIIAALVDEIKQGPHLSRSKTWKQSQKEKNPDEEKLTKDLAIGLFVLLLTFSSHFLGPSGIFSLSLIFKLFYQILFFPSQTCSQIYNYFLILHDVIRKLALKYSEALLDNFHKNNVINIFQLDSPLTFILILSVIGLISIFSVFKLLVKFVLSTKNSSPDKESSDSQFRIIISSSVKKPAMLFTSPIIFLWNFIKFLLLSLLSLFSNLISFFIPRRLKNYTCRAISTIGHTLSPLFKGKFILWYTLNCFYVLCGFLLNKMWSSDEIKIDLDLLRLFLNSSFSTTSEFFQSNHFLENSSSEWFTISTFSSFLNIFNISNIFCIF